MFSKRAGLYLLLLFLYPINAFPQLEENRRFNVGAIVGYFEEYPDSLHATYDRSGMNTVVHFADESTRQFLNNYTVIPWNQTNGDWIHYYATGLYSKWEAEEDQTDSLAVGVKHLFGADTTYNDTTCWYISGLNGPADSVLYGPHYRQWKTYKRWSCTTPVNFIARYNIALQHNSQPGNAEVCRITVRIRHVKFISGDWDRTVHVDTLKPSVTLKVSDFDPDGHFKPIYFSDILQEQTYNYNQYPPHFDASKLVEIPASQDSITYDDSNSHNGVEFCLEWLGNDQMTLYIDNVEVYDNAGWNDYVNNPNTVIDRVTSYANSYSDWTNIKYWYAHDEPSSRDAFIPIRTVDEILASANAATTITHYYDVGLINGEDLLEKFVQVVQPEKLLIDLYPFHPSTVPLYKSFNFLRLKFEEASTLDPDFYYTPQAFGHWDIPNHRWITWRRPDTSEFKAPIMLSLAHGGKGLIFSDYESTRGTDTIRLSIVASEDSNFAPRDLWYVIHNNLVPRLQGKLGNRLMDLIYTHGYISAQYFVPTDDPSPQTYDYLTLPYNQTATTMNWHAGFFNRNGFSDDKYFFLVNLLPNTQKSVLVKVTPPVPGFYNYRFRNYEGQFDTTFFTGSYLTYSITHPAGEGYLYEVAPVVKYGGKLYHDETISSAQTLRDDMIIESGVTLTVDAAYDCYANIYLKGSGKIKTVNGGTITFHSGKGIIASGSPTIQGTSSHKLTIDFNLSPNAGIQLLQGANTQISYCVLKNAENLIFSDNSQFYTNISYCDFQNSSGYAVTLAGVSSHNPYITRCTFTDTDYGIFAAGQSAFTISYNTFTDNKLALNLSQVSSAQIIANTISSDLNSDPGIQLSSCGGNIRANEISGHSIGLSLANSSPQVGENIIENNYINGIYVGTGSVPDLRAALVGISPNKYPISGYNLIRNNGGFSTPLKNDDGSEIYFENSNIQLNYGCNYIADDRSVTPPLVTALYLMNGSITTEIIQALNNAWGDTVYASRFGTLSVNFTPYNDTICTIPQSEGMLIISDNEGNILDTLYSAGTPEYTPTSTDLQYSEALEDMILKDYASSDALYGSIISNAPSSVSSQNAYLGLYKSKRLQNSDSTVMAALREMFTANLGNITDSVMKKVVGQLSLLTLVDQRQYTEAINGFSDIILQNPESEEAIFAEIDAMTTSLIAGNGNDTTLGKGLAKGLLVKGFKDYQDRINNLIHKKFGTEAEAKDKELIPSQYFLYNNYPNPFNPATTIRFDIPERTNVELIIYDILGRRVKSLVNNEVKNPGRYEVSFNAGALASGVYIYKLTTKTYSQARKMLLVK